MKNMKKLLIVGLLSGTGSLQLHRTGVVKFVLSRPVGERALCGLLQNVAGGGTLYEVPARGNFSARIELQAQGKTRRSAVYRYAMLIASSSLPTVQVRIAHLVIQYIDGGAVDVGLYRRRIREIRKEKI